MWFKMAVSDMAWDTVRILVHVARSENCYRSSGLICFWKERQSVGVQDCGVECQWSLRYFAWTVCRTAGSGACFLWLPARRLSSETWCLQVPDFPCCAALKKDRKSSQPPN